MENMEQKEPMFTQAQVDEIVAKRLGREKGKAPVDSEAEEKVEQKPLEEKSEEAPQDPQAEEQGEKEEPTFGEKEQPEEEPTQPGQEEAPGEEVPGEQTPVQKGLDPMLARVATAELKASMAVQGIDPAKLDRAVNLIKPEEIIGETGDVDQEKMAELISQLIQTWPELQKQQPRDQHVKFGIGQSSGGDTRNSAIAEIFGNR